MYYLQSRYYDPEVGRFINTDALVSTGQGLLGNNMFAYCLNNPINYYDPTGAQPAWAEMGFNYDGSMGDFRRLEDGLPPLAYEDWLRSQQRQDTEISVGQNNYNIHYKVTGLTNITFEDLQNYYYNELENSQSIGPKDTLWLLLSFGCSAAGLPFFVTGYVYCVDILLACDSLISKLDMQTLAYLLESNQSVLIAQWEFTDAYGNQETWLECYTWDEVNLPF